MPLKKIFLSSLFRTSQGKTPVRFSWPRRMKLADAKGYVAEK